MIAFRNNKPILAFAALAAGLGMNASLLAQYAQQPQEQDLQADQRALRTPEEAPSVSGPLEGAWIFTITDESSGNFFTALQAFSTGGVTVATGTRDRIPTPISPLIGSWKRTGRNRYVYTISFFTFNAAGTATGFIKSRGEVRLIDQDKLKGTSTGEACDSAGENCLILPGRNLVTGRRLISQGPTQ